MFTYTGEARNLEWSGHGFRLHFPEHVLPRDVSACVVDVKAAISGQFEFPEGAELVSGVYCIYCPHKFTQPVTVELQHCADITSHKAAARLRFVRAKCSQPDLPYHFDFLDGGVFTGRSSYGSIKLSHFSILGIVRRGTQAVSRWFYGATSSRYDAHLFYGSSSLRSTEAHFAITQGLELQVEVIIVLKMLKKVAITITLF